MLLNESTYYLNLLEVHYWFLEQLLIQGSEEAA